MVMPWRSALAVVLYAVAVVGMVAGLVSSWLLGGNRPYDESPVDLLAVYAMFVTYATVGVLVLVRQPTNTVGWLVGAVGFFPMLGGGVSDLYLRSGTSWPLEDVAVWIGGWYFIAAIATIPLLFLLFPDGRPASPRWRWPVRVVALALGAEILRYMVGPGDCGGGGCRDGDNPFQPAALRPFIDLLQAVGSAGMLAGSVAGVAALVWRFHRARGVERHQVKWVAAAAVLGLLMLGAFNALALVVPVPSTLGNTLFAMALALPAVAVAVAILRYRLYDIDRLVSRTLSYAVVTGLLLCVYLVLVTASSRLLPGDSSLPVPVSTLSVAALFHPLRRRMQDVVDRRFDRAHYDADRTLGEFSARLRNEVDLDAARADLISVVNDTVQPSSASLLLLDRAHPHRRARR